MKDTLKLFRRFLPIIFLLSILGAFFGLLTFLFYLDLAAPKSTINWNIIPIITVLLLVSAIGVSLAFAIKTEKIHIKRIKKNTAISKFANLLVATLASALFLFDFFRFVEAPADFSVWRILRLVVFVPFIAYMVIAIIPRKIRKKTVVIPKWATYVSSASTIIWCILGLITLYFFNVIAMTDIFKLIFMIYYIIVILFFVTEVQFELLGAGHRAYLFSALALSAYTFVLSGSITIGMFIGKLRDIHISAFEVFLSLTIGIYAFSKMIAIQSTLKYEIEKNRNSSSDS